MGKYYRLGDLAEIGRGSSPRPITDQRYFINGDIPWIKIADATASGKYIYKTREYVNEYGASFSRKLKRNSLIIAASGTLGFPKFLGTEGCIHDGWMYFSNIKEAILNRDYLYYCLITLNGYFNNLSYGAAIQNINTPIVRNTKVFLPDLKIQSAIASILSAYDDLIENNNKRITILEKMAENLYKEMFSYRHIKTQAEVTRLGSILQIIRGISYSSEEINVEEGLNLINLKNIEPYGGFRRDGTKKYDGKYKLQQVVSCGDLVMGVTDMTQDRRIVGSVAIVPNLEGVSVISADLIKITSTVDNLFLYAMFKYGKVSRYIAQFANGANVLHLKPQDILKIKVLIPKQEIISKYVTLVFPIFHEMEKLSQMNMNLTKQRDKLLPRLMSGKLEV